MEITNDQIETVAFESKEPYRGYTVKASYLKDKSPDALIEIFNNGELARKFLFPAYKVWNIAAHFNDIVDSEIEKNTQGYSMAASTGFGGSVQIKPVS